MLRELWWDKAAVAAQWCWWSGDSWGARREETAL